jgi:hypothetical protein
VLATEHLTNVGFAVRFAARNAGWLGLGLFLMAGCGSTDRIGVEGTVTLDGKPLEAGNLTLIPMSGTKGPTAGSDIQDGTFRIDGAKGVLAGTFRVEITAGREAKNQRTVYNEMVNKWITPWEPYLPARYNTASELRLEIVPGKHEPVEFALRMEG